MTIKIPERLLERLQEDSALTAEVLNSLTACETWLGDFTKGLPFFPEYTDHGPAHITAVLRSADALIPSDAFQSLKPVDVKTLILAILLHDSGMHLTLDGALCLIRDGQYREFRFAGNVPTWAGLWQAYVREAKNWTEKNYHDVFGRKREPCDPLAHDLPDDTGEWTEFDRRLVGEFLRRHHPRLAHEIAVYGVPGPGKASRRITLQLGGDAAQLVGFIARSHGMALRDAVELLRAQSPFPQETHGVRAVYLMVVLRIADYLEIEASRAPERLDAVRALRSPLSRSEWTMHQAIPVVTTHPDPEAIYVEVKPRDVQTYLKASRLLASIQNELDLCWAVLGEVYHSQKRSEWTSLTIGLRRVRSNLENKDQFAKTVDFVPLPARFAADSPQLMKLLVLPLYGNHPEVGIRELLQNALDAVRERQLIDASISPDDAITVSVNRRGVAEGGPLDWDFWVEVDDKGVGMSVDVLCNYFLKIGASFRASESWKSAFTDESGKPRVIRIGYFGIGVLAAFLLGDEIFVSTKDHRSDQGVSFGAKLSEEEIELKKISRPIGTTIQVRVSQDVAARLTANPGCWDWYRLPLPRVLRLDRHSLGGKQITDAQRLPLLDSPPPEPWRSFETPDFPAVHWTYESAPSLVCNGVVVHALEDRLTLRQPPAWPEALSSHFLRLPNISLADPNVKLPLNLQRTRILDESHPFFNVLFKNVALDFLAFCLVHAPHRPLRGDALLEYQIGYPGWRRRGILAGPTHSMWGSTAAGSTLLHAWHLSQLAPARCLCLVLSPRSKVMPALPAGDHAVTFWIAGKDWDSDATNIARVAFGDSPTMGSPSGLSDLEIDETQLLLPNGTIDRFDDMEKIDQYDRPDVGATVRVSGGEIWLSSQGATPSDFLKTLSEHPSFKSRSVQMAWEWTLSPHSDVDYSESLVAYWKRVIGDVVIPYDPNERRERLAGAFGQLDPLVKRWELIRDDEPRLRQ